MHSAPVIFQALHSRLNAKYHQPSRNQMRHYTLDTFARFPSNKLSSKFRTPDFVLDVHCRQGLAYQNIVVPFLGHYDANCKGSTDVMFSCDFLFVQPTVGFIMFSRDSYFYLILSLNRLVDRSIFQNCAQHARLRAGCDFRPGKNPVCGIAFLFHVFSGETYVKGTSTQHCPAPKRASRQVS